MAKEMPKEIDYILSEIHRIRNEYYKEGKEPIICVYMSRKRWSDMMRGIKDEVSSIVYDLYSNNGKSICGYKIYQVNDDSHGVKILGIN